MLIAHSEYMELSSIWDGIQFLNVWFATYGCRLNVIGSSTVKDGYDQPLGRSSIEFSAAQNEAQAKGLQISSSKR